MITNKKTTMHSDTSYLQRGSKLLLLVSATVLLSSCSVFQEYMRPQVKLPDSWHATLPHDGSTEALVDWWGQFNDPVLSQLLAAAEADNPSLDTALANIKSARASIISARAEGLPSLTGTLGRTRSGGGGGTTVGTGVGTGAGTSTVTTSGTSGSSSTGFNSGITDISRGQMDASWEVDLFGAIKFNKQAAAARLEARQGDWHEARVTLAAEVTNNYLDYRTCQLLVDAYERQLSSKNETARLTGIQAGAGFAAPADAELAKASANSTISSLVGQKAQCDNHVKSLVAVTGLDEPGLRKMLADGKAAIPTPAEFNLSSLPVTVINQRPDLVADERSLAAASADVGVAEANRYPSLSLTGSIGLRETTVGGNTISSKPWSFGPTLTVPIFDAGKLKAQKTIAEANYEVALATYQQSVRTAVKEVEQALVNLDSAANQQVAEAASAEQYRRYFKATEINWKAGGTSLITLEDARRQAINAELNLITQQHDRVQYWIALYKAIGGGWQGSQQEKTAMAGTDQTPSSQNKNAGTTHVSSTSAGTTDNGPQTRE